VTPGNCGFFQDKIKRKLKRIVARFRVLRIPERCNPDVWDKVAFNTLYENCLKAEQALVEKYQAFSAELLRLSLLGIGVTGVVLEKLPKVFPYDSRKFIALSIMCFGISSCAAIAHRYLSSETLRFFVWGMRWKSAGDLYKSNRCLRQRDKVVVVCVWAKGLSAATLAAGAVSLAIAFCVALLRP
jgi:hypothetical protein